METGLIALLVTAATVGFLHTILGPDHYLPFIVISKAKKWSILKTTWVTALCGLGHILSSVIIGFIGIFFGVALSRIEFIESYRGDIAGWLLLGFGLAYMIWGIKKYYQRKKHSHVHLHEDGSKHAHEHAHEHSHMHVHPNKDEKMTPWFLFIIFIFGPCEVLIPLLMYPAAQQSYLGVLLVTLVFGTATLLTMLGTVLLGSYSLKSIKLTWLEERMEIIAGFAIFLCGVAINIGL